MQDLIMAMMPLADLGKVHNKWNMPDDARMQSVNTCCNANKFEMERQRAIKTMFENDLMWLWLDASAFD